MALSLQERLFAKLAGMERHKPLVVADASNGKR